MSFLIKKPWQVVLAGFCLLTCLPNLSADDLQKPNILLISVDDLNDWVGCLGGHPQAKTPNIDRLAGSGMLFTNAHCPAPACNPSRTAIMTGLSPHKAGLYDNRQEMRELLPDAELLPKYFSKHGYWSAGSGKILHYFIDAQSWDEYYPAKETEDPFPRTLYPAERPVSLPRGGPWQYVETDWAALDASDEEYGGDWLVSKWIGEQLSQRHDKPFFLACGIYRPHEPWFVPKKYFESFPLDGIELPPGYQADDLDDLPAEGKKRGPNRYFAHIQEQGQWKQAIQGYLASIAFADAMVGRVLDALESGPNRDNTIVVLWSDHGWHLGEKQHWQKYTAWRVCTRVPLIVRVPAGTPGLPNGTEVGSRCDQPVNLLSLFPTLVELAGLPRKQSNDGPSLLPLLSVPNGDWPHASITYLNKPDCYSVSGKQWRYIHYDNGDEELYDIQTDPHEWSNLAAAPDQANRLVELKALAPQVFAEYVPASDESLPQLTWLSAKDQVAPTSNSEGDPFDVVFVNERKSPVRVYGIDRQGNRKSYGTLEVGWRKAQKTRPGAVWLITDSDDKPLGHFVVGDRRARAIVPNMDMEFERLGEQYIEQFAAFSPIHATGLGDHRFDGELDQISQAARAERLKWMGDLTEQLERIDARQLSSSNQVDCALLKHALEAQLWFDTELREWEWNPLIYTGLAGDSIYGLMARDFAPPNERLNNAAKRLLQFPRFLEQVRATLNVSRVPAEHAETAVAQNRGVLTTLDNMVRPLLEELTDEEREQVVRAMGVAEKAISEHQQWLESELLPKAKGDFRIGIELYEKKLAFMLHSTMRRQEIHDLAVQRVGQLHEQMYDIARKLYGEQYPLTRFPEQPSDAFRRSVIRFGLEKAYADAPQANAIVDAAKRSVAKATEFIRQQDLVTIMPDPLEIIIMPEFQRGVSLAYCDSPGPLETNQKTFYAVSPIPADWTQTQIGSHLREYNTRSMDVLTIHEAMPGHFLQLAHANRYPGKLRHLFQSGTFVEGWAVYTEWMMCEAGFLDHDPLLKLITLKWYLRDVTNALLDHAIHVDGISRQDAMQLMVEDAFQEEREAAGKWTRAQLTSAQLSTYFVGYLEHVAMRREAEQLWGEDFKLKAYHDQVLSFGSPPAQYVQALLLEQPIP